MYTILPILFAVAFTLHNIEEFLYLPEWSNTAGIFHPPVSSRSFGFAVAAVTFFGYLLTCAYLYTAGTVPAITYVYFGFVGMMIVNVFFPHVVATVFMQKYVPGTLTGVFLNLPIGLYLMSVHRSELSLLPFIIACAGVTCVTLCLIQCIFRLTRSDGKNKSEQKQPK